MVASLSIWRNLVMFSLITWVYYEKKITGELRYGSIANLKGIQVQRLFFWFNVDEMKVDLPPSDSIYFQVGVINKKLDAGQFKTVHSCRHKVNGGSCDGFRKQVFEVSEKKARDWCASRGDMPYFETSAKEGYNVDEAFQCVGKTSLAIDHEVDIYFQGISETVSEVETSGGGGGGGGCAC